MQQLIKPHTGPQKLALILACLSISTLIPIEQASALADTPEKTARTNPLQESMKCEIGSLDPKHRTTSNMIPNTRTILSNSRDEQDEKDNDDDTGSLSEDSSQAADVFEPNSRDITPRRSNNVALPALTAIASTGLIAFLVALRVIDTKVKTEKTKRE